MRHGTGHQGEHQGKLFLVFDEIPRSRGTIASSAEPLCQPYYADKGRPSIPPGRYFRMHFVGYSEGIDSERGIEWRCADSLSLREFLQLAPHESVPDHFSLSRTRSRLPLAVHEEVFARVLKMLAKAGLVLGGRIGVDASTMEANAALRIIVAPAADDLVRLDRRRKDKSLSNKDWRSPVDPEAKVAKMKDGRTWPTSRNMRWIWTAAR